MSDLHEPPPLNPTQQRITDELGATRDERPSFEPDLGASVRHWLEEEIAPLLVDADELPLFVSKHKLMLIHSCPTRYVAEEQQEFEWTVPSARGSVAHKAIELMVTWRGTPTPIDLVEAALGRLEAEERGVGSFIASLDDAERAELAGRANDFVTTFTETFPPLRRQWVPVAESRVRAELCDGALSLQGKIDLSLGRADGTRAGKVLFDLKTGRASASHREDLRFYALLETMKLGVPPRLLVNYYLEAGEPHREPVSTDVIEAAGKRLIDGVTKIIEATAPGADTKRVTGPGCRFCPALTACEPGTAHIAALDRTDLSVETDD
ncbi:MAG: PD-(D/E)XK nuclease family protein [Actinomycetota bacterium]